MPNSKVRMTVLKLIMIIMLAAIAYKLFDLQIINGETYLEVANDRLVTNITQKAPRGEILDRYGEPLVTNQVSYNVVLQRAGMNDAELNNVIYRLVAVLYSENCEYNDTLPISFSPYTYNFTDENGDGSTEDEKNAWFENNKYKDDKITADMSADAVIEAYKEIYGVSDEFDIDSQRRIVGIRYEAQLRGFSSVSPFVAADNVTVNAVAKLKEIQLRGISITNDYIRSYAQPGLATHILGRTGRINAEEYAELSQSGYGMNDMIGKQGIEKSEEKYLRGTDGTAGSMKRVNGKEITLVENVAPVSGNNVILTVDSKLQRVVEESLGKNINNIRASSTGEKTGEDCVSGAAVVLDVKSSDVLAMVSYPSYDMSRFNEDYDSLISNDAKPMWNRAVSGLYSPGSTFKPLTAIAALQSGKLGLNEIIHDDGIYTVYADYQPACWIWTDSHGTQTHGDQNVSAAIENSCNYFFYEVGRRMGIKTIDEYATRFGLGDYTGIELDEEAKGAVASPDYKKSIIKNVTSRDWYDGDTLQAAIGQSYSLFTPVQLASYAATIANGGTRYKVHLVKSIRSSMDGTLVKETQPEVLEQVDIEPQNMTAVKNGMKRVVDEGSAASVFTNYAIAIGGKTGTAQVGDGSNNAVFIAYAPFDDPKIAVAVVLEHGVRGVNAAQVAKEIFDYYFNLNEAVPSPSPQAAPAEENALMR
ncbi:MAG: penicillin-binding transpeptidase domain-containing protein [Clostridiales bacterium]|nr:penicillin-binding transpeptidase domain-containing protein [Clostridiales bacterium]